jgi:acetyl/propionyl-CoA carboxylase alpha subunit
MAKLIAFGSDRLQAIARMKRALDEMIIAGVTNNIGLHKKLLSHEAFLSGDISTHFIEKYYRGPDDHSEQQRTAIAVAAALYKHQNNYAKLQTKIFPDKWLLNARKSGLRNLQGRSGR